MNAFPPWHFCKRCVDSLSLNARDEVTGIDSFKLLWGEAGVSSAWEDPDLAKSWAKLSSIDMENN